MKRWLECVRSYENERSGALSSLQLDPAVPVPGPYGGESERDWVVLRLPSSMASLQALAYLTAGTTIRRMRLSH
jgi:hypothetical protein